MIGEEEVELMIISRMLPRLCVASVTFCLSLTEYHEELERARRRRFLMVY